jgi:hypothetical protein
VQALSKLDDALNKHVQLGLEATLEAIAARAKQTTTFVDRTGLLRNSIRAEGVTGTYLAGDIEGTVSFGAMSTPRRGGRGFPYGLAQEYGTRTGVREKRFMRDAIDAELGGFLEDGLRAAFQAAGFEVVGG